MIIAEKINWFLCIPFLSTNGISFIEASNKTLFVFINRLKKKLAIRINRTDNPNGTTSMKSTLLFKAKPLSPAIKKSKAAIKKGKNDKKPKK